MKELYIEVFSDVDGEGHCSVPLESLIILFNIYFCERPSILVNLVTVDKNDRLAFNVILTSLLFEIIEFNEINSPANVCKLPIMVMHEGTTVVAGVCAVIRQIFKYIDPAHPYLGFKQSCLYACAETSVWTRFCEIDALKMVEDAIKSDTLTIQIPKGAARFENHMSQPVRIHNIQKVKQDMMRTNGGNRNGIPDSRLQIAPDLEHLFAEGKCASIADLILFPCFHILFQTLDVNIVKQFIPLTFQWYTRLQEDEQVSTSLSIYGKIEKKYEYHKFLKVHFPFIPSESLYKHHSKRYKSRDLTVKASLQVVESLELDMVESMTFGSDIDFDWGSVPFYARPEGGDLPTKRAVRKKEQLENLTRAVLKVARNGDRIVDFCTGSGHLGLILAHFLPRCTVVFLDNKEESLDRARARAKKLRLTNIIFCLSNIDYFCGRLEVGVSLHACGVATDLVIAYCLRWGAAFVCCPCCYGSVQPNHMIDYPRSSLMKELPLSQKQYFVLGHAADQTHECDNSKTPQGYQCMNFIDADRCFQAREAGYWVSLSKLMPPSCTPKNNLLIGLPAGYTKNVS